MSLCNFLVYTAQVNSAFDARWLVDSEVIFHLPESSGARKSKNRAFFSLIIVTDKVALGAIFFNLSVWYVIRQLFIYVHHHPFFQLELKFFKITPFAYVSLFLFLVVNVSVNCIIDWKYLFKFASITDSFCGRYLWVKKSKECLTTRHRSKRDWL